MLKVVWNIIKYVYGLIYAMVRPMRRLICRRRKTSTSDEPELMSVTTGNVNMSVPKNFGEQGDNADNMEAWDSWDNPTGARGDPGLRTGESDGYSNGYRGKPTLGVSSIQDYHFHQQRHREQQEAEIEPEPDFFQDMVPKVKKQTKLLIKKKEEEPSQGFSSRLAVQSDVPIISSELEAWQEDGGSAWESGGDLTEDLTHEAEAALRETRKKERAERALQHQRRKQQKEQGRTGAAPRGSLGTKVS